jgi:flavin-dependent dehydrogenase
MLAAESILQSKEEGGSPSDRYQDHIHRELFSNLKWALYFSRFVFRFTKLAYRTLIRYPELSDFYLHVLEGQDTYEGFVVKVKGKMKDLLGGKLSEKIRRAMASI